MNEFLTNVVRNRVNEEFGRLSIIACDNDETPEMILLLDDVPLDNGNRCDTIIQSVIDNVDYCDNSTQTGDENYYCEEGIEIGVQEMLTNENVDVDGENITIVIQNDECNENVENACTKTNDDGKTIKQQAQF